VLGGIYYADPGGVLAAAMKLLRLGQNAAQALLVEAMAPAAEICAAAAPGAAGRNRLVQSPGSTSRPPATKARTRGCSFPRSRRLPGRRPQVQRHRLHDPIHFHETPPRIGIGGPVGSGKTMLCLKLSQNLRGRYSMAVVTR
jgi:hypothetical protein